MCFTQPDRRSQQDRIDDALRIGRQDITPLVKNCRWLVAYRKNRPDVIARYLYVLRCLTEAQERAVELGMGDGRLAQPLMPLPMPGATDEDDNFRWDAVLERVCPGGTMAEAA